MLKSKNMPYSCLDFGKGGQDKVLFPGLILSKSKAVELAPCTEKNEHSCRDFPWGTGVSCSRKMPMQHMAEAFVAFDANFGQLTLQKVH